MFPALKQYVPSEVCLACDGCCRFKTASSVWRPRVLTQEMIAHKDLASVIFAKEALDAGGRITTFRCKDGTHQCKFFSPAGNACTIYAYRPFECRLYPFVLMHREGGVVLAVHLSCPHIQGTDQSMPFVEYVTYLKKFFELPKVKTLLKNNFSLIDEYAEYRDELRSLFQVEV